MCYIFNVHESNDSLYNSKKYKFSIQNMYLDSTTMFCHWSSQHTQIVSPQSKVDTSIKKVPVPSIQKVIIRKFNNHKIPK